MQALSEAERTTGFARWKNVIAANARAVIPKVIIAKTLFQMDAEILSYNDWAVKFHIPMLPH